MKKWLISTAAITTGLCVLSWPVQAEDYYPTPPEKDGKWYVTFNGAGNELVSNFTDDTIQESLKEMQPGDTATFEIYLDNKYNTPVDWYMRNDVKESFESTDVASGGAYTYVLTYKPSEGADQVLYDSDTVGGEGSGADTGGVGLIEATNALNEEEYLYLERINTGRSAKMKLFVKLDGETQINSYQDMAADLIFKFAVEIPETKPGEPDEIRPSQGHRRRIIYVPNTSDPFKALPYAISGFISLILFIVTAYTLWRTRDEK